MGHLVWKDRYWQVDMCPRFQNRVGLARWHVPYAFFITYSFSVTSGLIVIAESTIRRCDIDAVVYILTVPLFS
jgi:hypothetical protein